MNIIWNKFCCGVAVVLVLLITGCSSVGSSGQAELRTSSDTTEPQRRASIRLQLAVGYYQQKQWSVALDELKQAIALDPNNADAYSVRAMVYMEIGETRLAEDNFMRAMSLSPNNPDLANNYGWFLCQNGQEAKSISYFEAAFKNRTYQSPSKALNNAGVCSLKLKDEKAAEQYFTQAFTLDAANPFTNTNMARLYYGRNDLERARFYMSRVARGESMTADMLWLAIRIERKQGDRSAESVYVAQLRRLYPASTEYAAYQRGAFDE
jgi:type IV pilus assembly protein PilF